MLKNNLKEELIRLLRALEDEESTGEGALVSHPDTEQVLRLKGLGKEQFSYSTPLTLDLRERVGRCALDNGIKRSGDVVALIMDTGLRSLGYPPPKEAVDGALRRSTPDGGPRP